MRRGESGDAIELSCPAKVNLSLRLDGVRDDGYHELESLMVPISLFDRLTFRSRADGTISLCCRWGHGQLATGRRASLPAGSDNLAWQAAAKLRGAAGVSDGAAIELVKQIPSEAGLGGASSDAAAVLLAGSRGWGLDWPLARLAEVAAELGSDVPFFLLRQAAIARGRGELLEPVRLPRLHLVIAKQPQGLSTAAVFRQADRRPGGPACRGDADHLVGMLRQGDRRRAAAAMTNDLEAPARELAATVDQTLRALAGLGVAGGMSGSGTACFAWCRSAAHAQRTARRLRGVLPGEVHVAASL